MKRSGIVFYICTSSAFVAIRQENASAYWRFLEAQRTLSKTIPDWDMRKRASGLVALTKSEIQIE